MLILADMGVNMSVVQWLRQHGHDVNGPVVDLNFNDRFEITLGVRGGRGHTIEQNEAQHCHQQHGLLVHGYFSRKNKNRDVKFPTEK